MDEEIVKSVPNMDIPQLAYQYETRVKDNDQVKLQELKDSIIKCITDDFMAPYYRDICSKFDWEIDETLMESMR